MHSSRDGGQLTPSELLTRLINDQIDLDELQWKYGDSVELRRWFILEESTEGIWIVDPLRTNGTAWQSVSEQACREWRNGSPLPDSWLAKRWKAVGVPSSAELLDTESLQFLLPLLANLRQKLLTASMMAQLFALLLQHDIDAYSVPLLLPILESEEQVLSHRAALFDARLVLRLHDVDGRTLERLIAQKWILRGRGDLWEAGPATYCVATNVGADWLKYEYQLEAVDNRPQVGLACVGHNTVINVRGGSLL